MLWKGFTNHIQELSKGLQAHVEMWFRQLVVQINICCLPNRPVSRHICPAKSHSQSGFLHMLPFDQEGRSFGKLECQQSFPIKPIYYDRRRGAELILNPIV
jgi:hypothetical protein